jgi:ABC-type transporter Mla subunit MlaD
MSMAALSSAIIGLGKVADDTSRRIGSLTESIPDLVKTGDAIKENLIDPLADLQKVLDTFQGPALGFKQMFEQIAKSVHEGTMDINEAREAIAKLLGMLERFALADRRAGDPGKINEIIQALERFLAEMSKNGRGGRP